MIKHLEKPINFDEWTERASSSGKLAGNPAGKTNMEKYLDAVSKIAEFNEQNKIKPLTPAKQRDCDELVSSLPSLEKNKDVIYLSSTAKTHLREVYWSYRSGHKRDIFSKYMENGKLAEPDAIKLISELDEPDLYEMGSQVYEKCNLPRQKNKHFEGECDIKKSPDVQDIKCCWDIFTYFPHVDELIFSKEKDANGELKNKWEWNENEKYWQLPADNIENEDYECQGLVYLELYGESFFKLRYCLVNMPEELMLQQFKWILRDFGGNEENPEYQDAIMEFRRKHTFDNLPLSSRVCTFKINRNMPKYLDLCRRVELSRKYLNWYSEEMFYFENPGLRPIKWYNANAKIKDIIVSVLDKSSSETIADYGEKTIELEKEIAKNGEEIKKINEETEDISKETELIISKINELNLETTTFEPELEQEKLFPHSLDDIQQQTYEIELKIAPIILDLPNEELFSKELPVTDISSIQALSSENDEFLNQINSLKTIDEAVEFYMENADRIDDTQYEQVYFAIKDKLSTPVEAPKIQKQKAIKDASSPQPNQPAKNINPKFTAPKVTTKEYTGNERYTISDGIKDISTPLEFELVKSCIIDYLEKKFTEWKSYKEHRDGITVFYSANKEVIERDYQFQAKISEMSKSEVTRLIDEARKVMLEQISKM